MTTRPIEHKWVWVHRWTLQCEYCFAACELEDGWPNPSEDTTDYYTCSGVKP